MTDFVDKIIQAYFESRQRSNDVESHTVSSRRHTTPRSPPPPPTATPCVLNWKRITTSGKSITFSEPVDVAYGSSIELNSLTVKYRYNVTGVVPFTPSYFGGDPSPDQPKYGWYRCPSFPVPPPVPPACSQTWVKVTSPTVSNVYFNEPVDVAYAVSMNPGATIYYRFNGRGAVPFTTIGFGDPAPGFTKHGWFRCPAPPPPATSTWVKCSNTSDLPVTFTESVDVAYGLSPTSGGAIFLYNVKGDIKFNTATFGGDPAPGIEKWGYYRAPGPVISPI